jgi:hypothetical protein
MMSIGDGKAEAAANSSRQILAPAPNSKEAPEFVRPDEVALFHSCLSGQIISNRPP